MYNWAAMAHPGRCQHSLSRSQFSSFMYMVGKMHRRVSTVIEESKPLHAG